MSYKNIGLIYGNIYLILANMPVLSNTNNDAINDTIVYTNISESCGIINSFIDWLPVNMDELNSRLYLMIGIMETICKPVWNSLSETCK